MELSPETTWKDTPWAWTGEEALVDHQNCARLCVATLLPFKDCRPDWAGFERSIRWMIACAEEYQIEIVFVLNADTGYIFNLSTELYREVIQRFRNLFPDQKIICGTTAHGTEGETFQADWYRPHLEIAQEFQNVEVMLMTSRQLNVLGPEKRRDAYFAILEHVEAPAIVHALEPCLLYTSDAADE